LPSPGERASKRRSYVVVIEDNRADIFLVEEAVAAHEISAELEFITDGQEAMRRISEWQEHPEAPRPDLFVLDLNLPKRSGVEVLAFIRASFPAVRIPVLIMTSSDSEKDRAETQRLEADGYFRKPSNYDEFLKLGLLIKEMLPRPTQ
jgi:chemotaxis family two-component system response regulator Rcp1